MKLNDEQQKQIIGALKATKTVPCPICAGKPKASWELHAFVPTVSAPADMYGQMMYIPCAVVTCSNCGYVRMHALHALGLEHLFQWPSLQQVDPPMHDAKCARCKTLCETERQVFVEAVNRLAVRDASRAGFFLADEAIASCDREVFRALTLQPADVTDA